MGRPDREVNLGRTSLLSKTHSESGTTIYTLLNTVKADIDVEGESGRTDSTTIVDMVWTQWKLLVIVPMNRLTMLASRCRDTDPVSIITCNFVGL